MLGINFKHLIFIVVTLEYLACYSFRRVKDGKDVTDEKRYAVYLVKAEPSVQKYDEWLCGGAIVTSWFIVTSAACVQDVQYMYAIAGYKKYVLAEKLDEDTCTKETKKKIVVTCVAKAYELDYAQVEKWATIDIAAVKVESQYDFNDAKYESLCSYKPITIDINYEYKYQEPGTDTLIMGWGHETNWRQPSDKALYNSDSLKFAPALITNKKVCKDAYANLNQQIDKYMICVDGNGNLNDKGEIIENVKPSVDGCITAQEKLKGAPGKPCEGNTDIYEKADHVNQNIRYLKKNKSKKAEKAKEEEYETGKEEENESITKKKDKKTKETGEMKMSGICQNDHGSPIVTWRGSQEILIGVASLFRVDSKSNCVGPYLFTSTQCNGIFLDCVINGPQTDSTSRRFNVCKSPPKERGFDLLRREISWADHPHGPAANEIQREHETFHIAMRPQIPISSYAG